MKPWRQLSESEQAELILAGAEKCDRCGGHGITMKIPTNDKEKCFVCYGSGYLRDIDDEGKFINSLVRKLDLDLKGSGRADEVQALSRLWIEGRKHKGRRASVQPPVQVSGV